MNPSLEPETLHRDRLEAGLLPGPIDRPEQVQELPAYRSVGLEMEHPKLLHHGLDGTSSREVRQVGLESLVALLGDTDRGVPVPVRTATAET